MVFNKVLTVSKFFLLSRSGLKLFISFHNIEFFFFTSLPVCTILSVWMRRELYKILICFVCVMKLFHGLSLGALTKPSIPHRLLHTSRDKTVVVVGGGAAGYFSAIECASKLQSENVKAKVSYYLNRLVNYISN